MKDIAKEAAGNWKKFESFAWHDQPEDADNWTIVYTSNRDSGPLDRANAKAIRNELEPFIENGDVVEESHNHWAVGYVDGYSIRVFDAKGEVTEAFLKWLEINKALEDYPVLDDELHSEEQQAEIEESWGYWAGSDFVRALNEFVGTEYDRHSNFCNWRTHISGKAFNAVQRITKRENAKSRLNDEYRVPHRVREEHNALYNSYVRHSGNVREKCKYPKCFVFEEFIDSLSYEETRELFEKLAGRSNTYWEEESSGMTIDMQRVVEAFEFDDIKEYM